MTADWLRKSGRDPVRAVSRAVVEAMQTAEPKREVTSAVVRLGMTTPMRRPKASPANPALRAMSLSRVGRWSRSVLMVL